MRIIAGYHRGRLFKSPARGACHPMSERAKMALFNILGDLTGLTVLDAYAGSGALAFEAISRGAISATCVEINRRVFEVLVTNCQQLGFQDQVSCYRANITSWIKRHPDDKHQLILADPPYQPFKPLQLEALASWAKADARLVISFPSHWQPETVFSGRRWWSLTRRNYAGATIAIYQKKPS